MPGRGPFALVTAIHLDQLFLVGAPRSPGPPPTSPHRCARGIVSRRIPEDVLDLQRLSFTPERMDRARRAGLAAVLRGRTDIVIRSC